MTIDTGTGTGMEMEIKLEMVLFKSTQKQQINRRYGSWLSHGDGPCSNQVYELQKLVSNRCLCGTIYGHGPLGAEEDT